MANIAVVVKTREGAITLDWGADGLQWNRASRQGIRLPAICHQGRCLTCAGKLIEGSVDQADADAYFAEDRAAGFVLLCRAKPLSDVRIRTHQEWEMRKHRLEHGLPAPYS